MSFRQVSAWCVIDRPADVHGPAHVYVHQRGGKGRIVIDLDPVVARSGKRVPLKGRGKIVGGIRDVFNQGDLQPGMILRICRVCSRLILLEVGVSVTVRILTGISRFVGNQTVLQLPVVRNAVLIGIDQDAGDYKIIHTGKQVVIEFAAHPPVDVSFRKVKKRFEVLGSADVHCPAHIFVHQRGCKRDLVVDLDPVGART